MKYSGHSVRLGSLGAPLALMVAGLLAATPATALDAAQERCVTSEMPQDMHEALYAEHFADDSGNDAFAAFAERAQECAIRHELPEPKQEAYVRYALVRSLMETSQKKLKAAGYPIALLDGAITALVKAAGGYDKVFAPETGITQDGLAVLDELFRRSGARLIPDDDVTLKHFSILMISISEGVSVAKQLDLDLDLDLDR
ncbi:MAG: hypothetical protein ACK4IS_01725 [Erythrobacter sp.]